MRAKDKCPSCHQKVSPGDFICANCELILNPDAPPEKPVTEVSVVRRMLEAPQARVPAAKPSAPPRPPKKPTTDHEGPTRMMALPQERTGIPIVVASLSRTKTLSEFEAYIVSLIDGASDVKALAKKASVRELELRVLLETLHDKMVVDFADEPLPDEPFAAPPTDELPATPDDDEPLEDAAPPIAAGTLLEQDPGFDDAPTQERALGADEEIEPTVERPAPPPEPARPAAIIARAEARIPSRLDVPQVDALPSIMVDLPEAELAPPPAQPARARPASRPPAPPPPPAPTPPPPPAVTPAAPRPVKPPSIAPAAAPQERKPALPSYPAAGRPVVSSARSFAKAAPPAPAPAPPAPPSPPQQAAAPAPAPPPAPEREPPPPLGETVERTDPRIVAKGANFNRKVLDALKQVKRRDATPSAPVTVPETPVVDVNAPTAADLRAQGSIQTALRMEQGGRLDEAIRYLERSIASSPDAPSLYNRLAIILMRERGDLKRAEGLLHKAIELAPENEVYAKNLKQVIQKQALKKR